MLMRAYHKKVTLNYTQLRIKGATVEFPMNAVKCKDNWTTAAEILHMGEIEVKSLIDKREKLVNIQKVLEECDDEEWLRGVLEP